MTSEETLELFRKELREGLADVVKVVTNSAKRPSVPDGTPPPLSAEDLKKTAKVLAHRDTQVVAHVDAVVQTVRSEMVAMEDRVVAQITTQLHALREETHAGAQQRSVAAQAAVAAANAGTKANATLSNQQAKLNGVIIAQAILALVGALVTYATRPAPTPAPTQRVEVVIPATSPTTSASSDAGVPR